MDVYRLSWNALSYLCPRLFGSDHSSGIDLVCDQFFGGLDWQIENWEPFPLRQNCPHHCEIYKMWPHSYKDLPVRMAEFGTVYRYEQSGELHGLTRVRSFTQDDAHIFCQVDQIHHQLLVILFDLLIFVLPISLCLYIQ